MPNYAKMSKQETPPWVPKMFSEPVDESLAEEVARLRQEIKLLREEIAPVPSLILTGKQVLEEFKQLQQTSK